MINKLTDGIVLGIIAGLLLATNFLYIIQTKGDNDQYWNSINKIQAVIKVIKLPSIFILWRVIDLHLTVWTESLNSDGQQFYQYQQNKQ